jgi:tripartite-type tricarboxylate transporter receptor subunit TctC
LAVTTIERSRQLPDTPTIAESGLDGFDTSAWFALLVAKATPEPVRAEIEKAAVAVLATPDVRERLGAAGIEVAADGATALQRRIGDETQMWRDVISKADIKMQ